jgi:hypothetical protein
MNRDETQKEIARLQRRAQLQKDHQSLLMDKTYLVNRPFVSATARILVVVKDGSGTYEKRLDLKVDDMIPILRFLDKNLEALKVQIEADGGTVEQG